MHTVLVCAVRYNLHIYDIQLVILLVLLTIDPWTSYYHYSGVVSSLYIVGTNCIQQRCRCAPPKFYKFTFFTIVNKNSTNLINEHCKNTPLLSEKHNYVSIMSVFGGLNILKRLGAILPCVL